MVRILQSSVVILGLALSAVGCSNSEQSRTGDLPVKTGGGVDKKGNHSKTTEIGLEDPSVKKK